MQLKFSLLDEDDLKSLETTLVRAMVRAFRVLAKEGLFASSPSTAPPAQPEPRAAVPLPPTSGWPVAPALPPEPPPGTPVIPEERTPVPDEVVVEPTEEDVVNGSVTRGEGSAPEREVPIFLRPPPASPYPTQPPREPAPRAPRKTRKKQRSAKQVCKTVKERPHGFIQTDEACALMGGAMPSAQLSQYLHNREIEGLIVTDVKPPSKGLPGRLMINKASLLARLELRDKNKNLPVRHRTQVPSASASG